MAYTAKLNLKSRTNKFNVWFAILLLRVIAKFKNMEVVALYQDDVKIISITLDDIINKELEYTLKDMQ